MFASFKCFMVTFFFVINIEARAKFFTKILICRSFIFHINGYNKDAHIDVYTLDP